MPSPIPSRPGSMIEKVKPPVKWAGGKKQLLPQFQTRFPAPGYHTYIEPFVGGGAVFFHLRPERAVLLDNNPDLINFYLVLRDHLPELLADLAKHLNNQDYYYRIRALDPSSMDEVSRASRFLYLNKTAYNGLWRVNKKGEHNVPFGRYKKPNYLDAENLCLAGAALQKAEIYNLDFSEITRFAHPGDFVYFDPPYDPLSPTASFTSYTSNSFTAKDQKRLAEIFRHLDQKGCLLMLSNSDTPLIRGLYKGYDIGTVNARRAINCRPEKRGPVSELVIRNYK